MFVKNVFIKRCLNPNKSKESDQKCIWKHMQTCMTNAVEFCKSRLKTLKFKIIMTYNNDPMCKYNVFFIYNFVYLSIIQQHSPLIKFNTWCHGREWILACIIEGGYHILLCITALELLCMEKVVHQFNHNINIPLINYFCLVIFHYFKS